MAGVSLLTQMLYAAVFVTRYLDLFRGSGWRSFYLVFFKFFYIFSSFYIIFLMMKVYPRTRERERAWKMALGSIVLSLVLAPIVTPIFDDKDLFKTHWFTEVGLAHCAHRDLVAPVLIRSLMQIMWAFSIILESVCVLPQLLLLRQTTVPTVIDSYYLLALGSYRAFYILNWFVRGFGSEKHWDPIAMIFGILQTAFYVDFAWVYYSRQRVKLRNGGVVDSEDYSKSWIVNKVFNIKRRRESLDEEQNLTGEGVEGERGAGGDRPSNNHWGARGISISADDTLDEHTRRKPGDADNEGLEGFLEDEDDSLDDQTDGQSPLHHAPVTSNRD
jgi:hypothetical protein